ncbi:hypothetical protein D9M70_553040 [compost metagenome]
MLGIAPAARREPRIGDLDGVAGNTETGVVRCFTDAILTTHEDRRSELLINECDCRAYDTLLLAFRKDDTLRLKAHAVVDALKGRSDRIAAGGQLLSVFLQIVDVATCDAGLHRSLRDGERNF